MHRQVPETGRAVKKGVMMLLLPLLLLFNTVLRLFGGYNTIAFAHDLTAGPGFTIVCFNVCCVGVKLGL